MGVFTMVVIVVAIGCGSGVIHDYLKTRRLEAESKGRGGADEAEFRALEERIRVLEKIVTDDRYDLRRELNRLDELASLEGRAARRG